MVHNGVALVILMAAFFVLYRFVIPRLFPEVVHKVGVVRLDADSNVVYAFDSPGMPIVNGNNRSQVKANTRRRRHNYEAAMA